MKLGDKQQPHPLLVTYLKQKSRGQSKDKWEPYFLCVFSAYGREQLAGRHRIQSGTHSTYLCVDRPFLRILFSFCFCQLLGFQMLQNRPTQYARSCCSLFIGMSDLLVGLSDLLVGLSDLLFRLSDILSWVTFWLDWFLLLLLLGWVIFLVTFRLGWVTFGWIEQSFI